MLSRRALLAAAAAFPLSAAAPPLRRSVDAGQGLRDIAAGAGRSYGCAVATYQLQQPDFKAALLREAAVLVAEYEMKRKSMQPEPDRFDFAAADLLTDFAAAHGLGFRGHTLVWYATNPAWLEPQVRATRKEALFTDYIAKVMRRYRGRVGSWDVVNEVIEPRDGRADGLRRSFWLETFGPSYIDTAFHAARQADPEAQLVYNDWGCELEGEWNERFRTATLRLLEGLKRRNVPVDALGLQGHLQAFGKPVAERKLASFLHEVRAMGYRILVTELDVDDSGGPLDVAVRDRAVADNTRRFLDVVLPGGAENVLTWGLSDRFLDPPGLKARLLGYEPRRLPLDPRLAPTPMRAALARSLGESGR